MTLVAYGLNKPGKERVKLRHRSCYSPKQHPASHYSGDT